VYSTKRFGVLFFGYSPCNICDLESLTCWGDSEDVNLESPGKNVSLIGCLAG
jgi:hypothetical protein